jgi:hypothetical protein
MPTNNWKKFRTLPKFDRSDIMAAHSITKRDAGILYIGLRKIHYNVMRHDDTMTADEADALRDERLRISLPVKAYFEYYVNKERVHIWSQLWKEIRPRIWESNG